MKPAILTYSPRLSIVGIMMLLFAAFAPTARVQAVTAPVTVELTSVADARIQGGSPDVNFGSGFLWVGTTNGHLAYVQFDLLALPANATITNAELHLNFTGVYTETANVEVGRADGPWDETSLTWNTRPANTFNNNSQIVGDTASDIVWPVTGLVAQWHSGATPNNGFALRGDGPLKAFHSRETHAGLPPRLVITYTLPSDEPTRPDLGDAPDSSNNLGLPNTAYTGIPGRFPTVWNGTPAGQPAGPRHANQTIEGFLGDYLSREVEADSGNDEDGRNNILNGGVDVANEDRGDDGWRNRTATFPQCGQTTLRVRVSKPLNATLDHMFLNVWFDGVRDGDWADRALCTPQNETLAIPAYEWIVQDYYVDMTGIPAGGYVDIDVTTTTILNTSPGQSHWMRFTLSEARAVQSSTGRADGRGPHPSAGSFQFGETEDVLQRRPPPGEDGTLELQKQVITGGEPVDYAGTVTYRIRLRHNGGSQPVQAEIRDVIEYPQHVLPQVVGGNVVYVDVQSPTGGASPLQATLDYTSGAPVSQVVKWNGTLEPNAEVIIDFKVHVHPICGTNQQTATVNNHAQARPAGGAEITADASFLAKCPGYNPLSIEFNELNLDDINLADLTHVRWNARVTNNSPEQARLRFYSLTGAGATPNAQNPAGELETITFAPNESKQVSFSIPLDIKGGDLSQSDATPIDIKVGFCYMLENDRNCPDRQAFPQYHGEAPPLPFTPRPNDLGDAPDSSNHGGTPMTAYPGVQANYPTVFDPATGAVQGPRHVHPQPFHLGQQVSREAEADLGPDQDPLNNIVPAADDPNNDRFDDGVQPGTWAFTHCQTTIIPTKVFISPQAVAWFQQQNMPGYINIWLDANRDGDWADGTSCGGGGVDGGGPVAVEHITIDYPLDVVALGAGLHTVNVPTSRVPWPAQLAQQPTWVRVTLSDHESNKTLQYGNIQYGDGRGFATPFRTGETEDYLWRPGESAVDLGVALDGRAERNAGVEHVVFKIEYANLGASEASGATLTFTKPAQFSSLDAAVLQAPGIAAADIVEDASSVTLQLPSLQSGDSGIVILGWDIPASQPPAGDYNANVVVTLTGDADSANNQASLTVARAAARPNVAALAANGAVWGFRETTCRTDVELRGVSIPNALFQLLVDGAFEAGLVDADDTWNYHLQNLAAGRHEIRVTPLTSTPTVQSAPLLLDVDPTLPVDPLSLSFTDSQGRVYHPPTLNWRQTAAAVQATLRDGETYELAIDTCLATPNQQHDLVLPNGDIVTLTDNDGDGRYTGTFVFNNNAAPAATIAAAGTMHLLSGAGGARQYTAIATQSAAPGVVRDATTATTLAGAEVTLLTAQPGGGVWPAAALGTPNPQTTGVDGRYSFGGIGGHFQLSAIKNGYQPYRSPESSGDPNRAITLTAEPAGAPATTIYITANGFAPSLVEVTPGSVIEWVNLDVVDHATVGGAWDSGLLAPGQRYRAVIAQPGSYTYDDAVNANNGVVVVKGSTILLPIVIK